MLVKNAGAFFLKLFACYADGDGDSGETQEPQTPPADDSDGDNPPADAPKQEPTKYWGSKELNPEGRPLKVDISEMTRDEVDFAIVDGGPEIFMSDEEIAQANAKKEKKDEKQDKKEPDGEKKDPEKDLKDKTNGDEPGDVDPTQFLEKLGLKQEEFAALPEKVQERLVDNHVAGNDNNEKAEQLQREFDQHRADTETIYNDPVIAARIQELQDGRRYVAKSLPPIKADEVQKLDELLTDDKTSEAIEYINKIIAERAREAVAIERQISDSNYAKKELQKQVTGLFKELGQVDKRLKIEGVENFAELRPGHPKWAEWERSALRELKDYCVRRNWSMQHIVDMGKDELLSAFSAHKGWQKERDTNIIKTTKEAMLKALLNPKPVAKGLPANASRNQGSQDMTAGFDRGALKAELIAGRGRSQSYERMLELNEGNTKVQDELFRLHSEVQNILREEAKTRR